MVVSTHEKKIEKANANKPMSMVATSLLSTDNDELALSLL
jgi:hypothetical protein